MDRLAIAAMIYSSMIGRSTRDLSTSTRSPLQADAIHDLAVAALSLADALLKAHEESARYPASFDTR